MKRILAVCITLLLLLGAAAAQAQSLRVLDEAGIADAYLEAYPDRTVDVLTHTTAESGQSNEQELLLDDPDGWDVALIWSNAANLTALDDASLLLDLNQDSDFAERADGFYTAVQNAVTIDGRLVAMPVYMTGAVQQFSLLPQDYIDKYELSDLLTQLDLGGESRPQTFAELCGLAQRYLALPAEARRGTTFNCDVMSGNATAYFMRYMIELYTAQYCDQAGNIVYDTPAFRSAVADVDALAVALSKASKVLYMKDSNMICGLLNDSGSALISSFSPLLYLGISDNTALPAVLLLAVVNPQSEQQEEAFDFVRCAIQVFQAESDVVLIANPDYETLARQNYDETIAIQIQQNEDQSVIDALIAERDAGGYPRFYSRDDIEAYRQNAAPRLTFPCIPQFDAYTISQAYAAGKLDVDSLIDALTEATQNDTL